MTASSQPRGELKTIFSNTEDSIKKKLENPPRLRWAGWDLTHLDQPKIIRGELIRVTNGDAKVIDLYRDGTMVFVALADRDFLAWASKDDFERINSLALPEAIYAFLRFYELVLGDFYNKPENVDVRVALNNLHLDGVKTMLMPYSLESLAQHFNGREAPEPNGLFELRVPSAAFRPEAVTYQLVREIYLWFGLGEEKIPYHKQDGGVEVFDTEPLTKKN